MTPGTTACTTTPWHSQSTTGPSHDSHHQTAGQDPMEELPERAVLSSSKDDDDTYDCDYQPVNHLLGQLHRQRQERRRNAILVSQPLASSIDTHSGHHSHSYVSRSVSKLPLQELHFHPTTPPQRPRRKEKQLHTDTKLG